MSLSSFTASQQQDILELATPEAILNLAAKVDIKIDKRFPAGPRNLEILAEYIQQKPFAQLTAATQIAQREYKNNKTADQYKISWESLCKVDNELYQKYLSDAKQKIVTKNLTTTAFSLFLRNYFPFQNQEICRQQDCIETCLSLIDSLRKRLNPESPRSVNLLQIIDASNTTATDDEKIIYCALEVYACLATLHKTLTDKAKIENKPDELEMFMQVKAPLMLCYKEKAKIALQQLTALLNDSSISLTVIAVDVDLVPRPAQRSSSQPEMLADYLNSSLKVTENGKAVYKEKQRRSWLTGFKDFSPLSSLRSKSRSIKDKEQPSKSDSDLKQSSTQLRKT